MFWLFIELSFRFDYVDGALKNLQLSEVIQSARDRWFSRNKKEMKSLTQLHRVSEFAREFSPHSDERRKKRGKLAQTKDNTSYIGARIPGG